MARGTTTQNNVPKLKIYTHARKNQLLLDEPIVLKFIDVGTNETINETICAFYDRPEWEQKLMWSDQGCWLDYEKEGKHLILFSNFYCMFLNPKKIFQFEF